MKATYALPLGYTLKIQQDPDTGFKGVASAGCVWVPHVPPPEDMARIADAYRCALSNFIARQFARQH